MLILILKINSDNYIYLTQIDRKLNKNMFNFNFIKSLIKSIYFIRSNKENLHIYPYSCGNINLHFPQVMLNNKDARRININLQGN